MDLRVLGMSVSAPNISPGETDTADPLTAMSDNAVSTGKKGHQQWLVWLQSLLSASGLVLYRFDTSTSDSLSEQVSIELLSCLLESPQEAERYAVFALRSARTDAVVSVKSEENMQETLCCIPDVSAGENRRFRHVLVVVRNSTSKLDAQTQARLVVWAFSALNKFSTVADSGMLPGALSRWMSDLAKVHSNTPDKPLTQLMDKLTNITGSKRCLLAGLQVKGGRVNKVGLLSVSGQSRLDKRLSATSVLLSEIKQSFMGKDLPLDVIAENHAQPAMLENTSLASTRESCSRLIVPLEIADVCFAVMLERAVDLPFKHSEIKYLQDDLHAALTIAHLSDPRTRSVMAASMRMLRRVSKNMQSSVPRIAIQATLLVAALIFLCYPAEHRISAPLNVEAAERHVLIAPVDGYMESVAVTAGDAVLEGQTLATLDDRDVQMQLRKRQSEAVQNTQAYDKALASHDRVEVSRLKESAALIQTELRQLDMQHERMTLKAPVDAVVLSGSWDDSLGAAVSTGDILFTLGSASSYRLVLDVSEYDVGQVSNGQPIDIRLSSDPSTVLKAEVTAIMPLAVASAGVNSVQVHARLLMPAQLRPGMQGIGKIVTGRQMRFIQWAERVVARVVWLGWRLGVLT